MKLKPRHWLIIISLIIITLFPLKGLVGRGITDAHDSISHVVRVYSFYESLKQGNIFPRWSQHLNYGYGHPIFMFLYPLPSYWASLFLFFGFPVITSIKLVLGLSYALAGIFAYLWFRELVNHQSAALIGAAVFQLAPYRFVNLYVRNAYGENTAILFIPLVFWLITRLIKKPNRLNLSLVALSWAGLILSHNAISLMIIPLLGLYAFTLLLFFKNKLSAIFHLTSSILLGFGLSAFFWIPAFMEGKYTLREIVMQGDTFAQAFVYPHQLISLFWGYSVSAPGPNDGMSFQIGILQWLAFLVATFLLLKHFNKTSLFLQNKLKRKSWLILLLFWLTFAASVFIMLQVSLPIWRLVTIIKKFQFPWRFLTLSVVSSAGLAALVTYKLNLSFKLAGLIVALLVLQTVWYWHPKGFLPQSEQEIVRGYTGTTDTGESTPLWAIRFQEKPSSGGLSVVSGAPIDYQIIRREAEIHEYLITATVKTQISANTLYFPGWKVYVDGQKVPIIYADPNWRGEITFPVTPGTHQVKIVFEETRLRRFANTISIIALLAAITIMLSTMLVKLKYEAD